MEDQLGLAVAGEVGELRGFVVDDRVGKVPLPILATFALRVEVPVRLGAGEPDDEDVGPLIAVEVVREGEEVLRVFFGIV